MIINKITSGFVVQQWDTDLKAWIRQEFVAGDPVEYETEFGGCAEPIEGETYLPFSMKDVAPKSSFFVLEIIEDIEPKLHGPFETEIVRDNYAKELRVGDPGKHNGLYPLTICDGVSVGTYSGEELM